jgi:hypothetical protein
VLELLWIQEIFENNAKYEAVQLVFVQAIQAIYLMDTAVYEEVGTRRKSARRGAWGCVIDGVEAIRALELSEELLD